MNPEPYISKPLRPSCVSYPLQLFPLNKFFFCHIIFFLMCIIIQKDVKKIIILFK